MEDGGVVMTHEASLYLSSLSGGEAARDPVPGILFVLWVYVWGKRSRPSASQGPPSL
jgi:hypothetical protein